MSRSPGTGTEGRYRSQDAELSVPRGLTEHEAAFLLGIFARLKEKRFGRVELTVREGALTGVEFVERVDRNRFRSLGS
jgi:hypothetical protein